MYKVLYRKYRPRLFSDVVGQEYNILALKNSIISGKLAHAYLFAGSRGTGKTSCAKIFAKALNCENSKDGEPCGKCASCLAVENGDTTDVIEMDAASNRGIDDIRRIIEEVNFVPSSLRYKVYIIDEVHELSNDAFNALLKTLEEPPEYVKFILATTEPQKLLATILSRCQRFDFKRIEPVKIAGRLKEVAIKEDIDITDDAALFIARMSDGALRDALSILDSCASSGETITEEMAAKAAGLSELNKISEIVSAAANKDTETALRAVSELYADSCDMQVLLEELIRYFRNMMITLSVKNYSDMIALSESETERVKIQAEKFGLHEIIDNIDILSSAVLKMKSGADRKTVCEITVIRLCNPELSGTLIKQKSESSREKSQSDEVRTSSVVSEIKKSFSEKTCENNSEGLIKQDFCNVSDIERKADENSEKMYDTGSVEISDGAFEEWSEIVVSFAETNPLLKTILKDSTAFIKGKFLVIDSENTALPQLLSGGNYGNIIKKAVWKKYGKAFEVAVNTKREEKNKKETDPFSELLKRASDLGFKN